VIHSNGYYDHPPPPQPQPKTSQALLDAMIPISAPTTFSHQITEKLDDKNIYLVSKLSLPSRHITMLFLLESLQVFL